MKSVLLLSGGMDSTAIAWWKRPDYALTIDYGQLAAEAEISASRSICQYLNIPHHVLRVNCRNIGSGDMAGTPVSEHAPATDWWPYRNQLLITLAGMKMLSLNVSKIIIGTVQTDNGHTDGSLDFIKTIDQLMFLQEGSLTVEAPAINLSTSELIQISQIPADLLAWAHSCHKSDVTCGNCRGCNKYFEIFEQVGYDLDKLR
ncbi:7-cyano-7-deazaguanine synthase [Acinetobacter sp. MB5]|uniref:7-cyano-7-deazaguanine synthase n=1 Tax=Acinetobacter sp. MB5 TaxID=2069438 RepID=UPI000DD0B68B|nr:7-cyano-7-deazaguanine synthase [Acinetobacter sp. MB5]